MKILCALLILFNGSTDQQQKAEEENEFALAILERLKR